MVFTRRPPTTTSRRRPEACASRACPVGFAWALPLAAGRAFAFSRDRAASTTSQLVNVRPAIVALLNGIAEPAYDIPLPQEATCSWIGPFERPSGQPPPRRAAHRAAAPRLSVRTRPEKKGDHHERER